jgi:two-component system, OmpR family, phosphate regulon sensor histidine kinase PhoR
MKTRFHRRLQLRLSIAMTGLLGLFALFLLAIPHLTRSGADHTHFFQVVGFLILVLVGWLYAANLAKKIASPLSILMDAMHSLAAGNTRTRVFFKHGDEVNEISDDLNRLAVVLESAQEERDHAQALLDILLTVVEEAMCICDATGRVRFANERFDRLTGRPGNGIDHIWELVRQADLNRMLHRAYDEKTDSRGEIRWDDRWYWAAMVRLGDEVILTLRDITDMVQNRQAQRDFLQNATHELKTPLTSIRNFIELLRDEPATPAAGQYIDTLERNTERLIRIVADLLQITRDEGSLDFERAPVRINDLHAAIVRQFAPECRNRGLILVAEPAPGESVIDGDAFRLEQALVNLMQNALNYTDQGEIRFTANVSNGWATFSVRDTGQGIPHHHLPFLFERFYVVDASRCRKYGGTGLGLAIVRQIAITHGGRVEVESTLGVGSEFRIVIPLSGGVNG